LPYEEGGCPVEKMPQNWEMLRESAAKNRTERSRALTFFCGDGIAVTVVLVLFPLGFTGL
jgi:hypothetical protein